MKPGDLVKRSESVDFTSAALVRAYNESIEINRKINLIWAFATNRKVKPPITNITVPKRSPGILLDANCSEFRNWIESSRTDDPKNSLSITVAKVLSDGEVYYTLLKWLEPIQKIIANY